MSAEKIKVLDVRITDAIKMVIEKYQNKSLYKVWAFKALEQAVARYVLDTEAEDFDPEFNFLWAITQLKADLRVLCFPEGGDEYDQWLDAVDP